MGNDGTIDHGKRQRKSNGRLTRRRALQAGAAGVLATTVLGSEVGASKTARDTASASATPPEQFVGTADGDFVLGGGTFYPLGGNHPQLRKESEAKQTALLDQWIEATDGRFNVLRASAFGSGTERTTLPLQPSPGEYDEAGFEALDRLIAACGERGVRLILPLTNYYPWQGGMDQYVAWADGAETRTDFYTNEQCQTWYRDYVEYVLTRTNTITGVEYREDPTIMLWELANEPEGGQAFLEWVESTANLIESLDSNHLVSTGAAMTIERQLFRQAHQPDNVDACSLHIWADDRHTGIGPGGGVRALRESKAVADDLGKPIYAGEFGWQVGRGEKNAIEDVLEINERNRVLEAWLLTMRDLGIDGSLVWDVRREGEYPLTWNWYAVFPQDYRTASMISGQYGAYASPPSDEATVATDPPTLAAQPASGGGRTQLTIPQNGGEFGSEPSFSLEPSGDEFADPGGDGTTGPDDVSADVYLGYDADNLYLRAEVTDDSHHGAATDVYQQDSIQWAAAADGAYGPEYGLSHANGSATLERYTGGNASAGIDAVDATTSRSGTTTTYDVTVPWEALFAESKGPGDVVPFSFLVNDNDSDDASRDGVLGWTLPGINSEKTAPALGLLVLESESGSPWQATSEGGSAIVNAGSRGTWTATVANYASEPRTFEVALDGTDVATTVEVASGATAEVTVERAFGAIGPTDLALSITNAATGETRTISEPVVVLEQGTPDSTLSDLPDPEGTRILSDPYADTSKLAAGSDVDNLVVNTYRPENHPLPSGLPDDTRLKRSAQEPTQVVYETDSPVSEMVLVWAQERFHPGTISCYESTDGGNSWTEISATTDEYVAAGTEEYPRKWSQNRSHVTGFSGEATHVKYVIEGGATYSPQPQLAELYTETDPVAVTGTEFITDEYADTSLLAPGSDAENFVVNAYRPEHHPLPDGSPDDTRLKRVEATPTTAVYAADRPLSTMVLVWSLNRFEDSSISFEQSSDGGETWSSVRTRTEQYATAGPEGNPEQWQQKRTIVGGFEDGATMVRYTIEGGAPYALQPQRAALYTPDGGDGDEDDPERGPELLRDPYADTTKLAAGSDAGNLIVNSYEPDRHPLPDGSPDDTRLKRGELAATAAVYETEEPIGTFELLWSNERFHPGTITFYESTDGGETWSEVAASTEQYATAGSEEYPAKWRQKRSTVTAFSQGATAVKYVLEGGATYSPQPQRAAIWGRPRPPIAQVQPSTTEATVGERVTFSVEDTSGQDRWIESLDWTFGDGTTGTGWWNAHRYDEPGEYAVVLTATDNTGATTTHEVTISVAELTEPIARIQPSTTEASVGERVTVRVEDASGEERWIDSLDWTFGDGSTDSGWWNAHRYESAGSYTVTLTATDNTGHSTTHEVTIEVSGGGGAQ